jgi:MscS family membrane protein
LFINLQTPPDKIEALIAATKGHLSKVEEIQNFNVLFNDIRLQAFIVFVEFFTRPIEWNRFTQIKQELNLFVLQTMEKLEIKIAAEGKEIAIVP